MLLFLFLLAACAPAPCVGGPAVVTDIDETLTALDAELIQQLQDAAYVPAMRPDADVLFRGLADRGYRVFYLTARGEDITLDDGRTMREATHDWLVAHDFPVEDGSLFLADGIGAYGEGAVALKAGVLADLQADAWDFAWGFGNAESDIEAFQQAGLPDERVFLVGELAGTMGVQAIPDEEAYSAFVEGFLPGVGQVACAP